MTSTQPECPSNVQLREFIEGRALTRYARSIESHVLQCRNCVEHLRQLEERQAGFSSLSGEMLQYEQFRLSSEGPARLSTLGGVRDATPRLKIEKREIDLSFLAPSEEPQQLGLLGKYRVTAVLGSGGMGVVLKARDPELERDVAIKVMRPEIASHPEADKRFVREGRALAAINNDYVVPVYEVCSDQQSAYFVMPYLQGETLRQRLQREPALAQSTILKIAAEIAAGLKAIHHHGLIHRDIKPANLFLEESTGRCILIDFGLVRTTQVDSLLTQQDSLPGTPAYVSPEQAQGRNFDARSDLFSVGCVLYELATGISPFYRENVAASLSAVMLATAPTPRSQNRNVSRPLSVLIMRLLEKAPRRRIQSAEQLQQAIANIQSGRSARINCRRCIAASVLLTAAAVLLGVVIKIRHSDRNSTTIETAQGSKVKIDERGNADIKLPASQERATESPHWKQVLESRNQAAYERGVAEWVISKGGSVRVIDIDASLHDPIDTISGLPVIPFANYAIHLRDVSNVSSEEVGILGMIANVSQLYLKGPATRINFLAHIPAKSRLTVLSIEGCSINTSQLHECDQLKNVYSLNLNAPQIDDDWEFLGELPGIEFLKVGGRIGVRKKIDQLSRSRHLQSQSLREVNLYYNNVEQIPDEVVERIQIVNPRCRFLSNHDGRIQVIGRDTLRQAVERLVREGFVFGGVYHNGGAAWSTESPQPRTDDNPFIMRGITVPKDVEWTGPVSEAWTSLTSCWNIAATNINGADRLAIRISDSMNCGMINFAGSDLTDRGFTQILKVPNLKRLYIQGTQVSQEAIKAGKQTRPMTQIVSDYGVYNPELPQFESK